MMLNQKMLSGLSQFNRLIYLLLPLVIIGSVMGFTPPSVHAQQVQNDHVSVYFVIDDSGSMKTNDPNDLRITAVKLFITLLDLGDGAAVITFAGESEIRANYVTISDYDDKVSLLNAIGDVKSDGFTNMKDAFLDVLDVTKQDQTGNQKIVLFLTDGKPEIPGGLPANYEEDTLALIRQADIPVLAIGLTSGGLTPFLGQVPAAAGEGSQIIPAKTANEILDVYLGILGKLKDRTIIGEGIERAPADAELAIDPALSQYIDSISFVAVTPLNQEISLIAPDGSELNFNENLFSESFVGIDPNFRVLTIPNPPAGNWLVKFEGNGEVQARAILRSRLRVKILEPGYFAPAGEPFPIVANLIVEDLPNPPIKSIGDATFSVLVEGPDDLRESLDLLYDDGTHGDMKSGDGDFTNLFVNTDEPGTYTITVTGRKGVVPVSARTQVEVIKFPELVVDSPTGTRYEIRSNMIPLQVHLNEVGPEQSYEGEFKAVIQSPGGSIAEINLEESGGLFTGEYMPLEDGLYQVSFVPINGFFQGQAYHYTAQGSFEAAIVANLIVQDTVVGLGESAGSEKFEVIEAKQGIPVVITVVSKSDRAQDIQVRLEQLPGFSIMEDGRFTIEPSGETSLTIHLMGDEQIGLGTWQGRLDITSLGVVDIINNQPTIAIEIYQPTIAFSSPEAISQVSTDSCLDWLPLRLRIPVNSTSVKAEKLNLLLDGFSGAKLSQDDIEILPGKTEIEVTLVPNGEFTPGEYSGTITLSGRDGLVLLPDTRQVVSFTVDPVWVTCQKPMIISGIGLSLLVIMAVVLINRFKPQKIIVTGTLIHWNVKSPNQESQEYLTIYNKAEIKIGKGPQNDIIIPDDSLEDAHMVIKVEQSEGNDNLPIIHPIAPVRKGYREYTSDIPLDVDVEYQIGNRKFKFISE